MRVLILSDIHANLTAFEAVLDDAGGFDAAWFLGDLVGYGPDPNECVERLRTLPGLAALMGNHDAAVLDQLNTRAFNTEARIAVRWTQETLAPENMAYLNDLPATEQVSETVLLAHGSPRQPVWEYILDTRIATENFHFFETAYCFVGHSHLPCIFHLSEHNSQSNLIIPTEDTTFDMAPRAIINPGSVGQPRDRDPRAAYAIYDPETTMIEFHRVAYDVAAVQARMRQANLPSRHIERLANGW